jgi:hypothetical protein
MTSTTSLLRKSIWRPRMIELVELMDRAYGDEYDQAHAELKALVRDVLKASGCAVKLGKRYSVRTSRTHGNTWQRVEITRDDVTVRHLDVDAGPAAYCRALAILKVS